MLFVVNFYKAGVVTRDAWVTYLRQLKRLPNWPMNIEPGANPTTSDSTTTTPAL
jgi:hypothetical protein